MLARRHSLAFLALILLLSACETVKRVDVQAEEQAISALDSTMVQAVAARDLITITNTYAEDGVIMPPGAPPATGPADIGRFWTDMLQYPNLSLTFGPTNIDVAQAGDLAVDVGAYRMAWDGPQGRLEDEGKYVTVWKKVGEQWKIAYDTFNSNMPPMAPPDTTAAPKS